MLFPTASIAPAIRDFRRGLLTPDFGVVKMAAIFLLLLMGILSVAGTRLHQHFESGEAGEENMPSEICRASIVAARGALRETDSFSKALVFVGPSALRCWLPQPQEAGKLATAATGTPTRVVEMCGNRQSYAFTGALIDRFGADFDGWIIIGVGRQTLGRDLTDEERAYHTCESRALAFESGTFRRDAAEVFATPQAPATGLSLWDHRTFFYNWARGQRLLFLKPQPYEPYFGRSFLSPASAAASILPLSHERLTLHLDYLTEIAHRVRSKGRARIALVETPWVDTFTPEMQTLQWKQDEAAYQNAMDEWAATHNIPWLTAARQFPATMADYSDPRHLFTPELRKRFVESVARELSQY